MGEVRKSKSFANLSFHPPRETDDVYRLALPASFRLIDRAADLPAAPDEFRVSVARDTTPISDCIRSLPGPVDVQAQVYTILESELDILGTMQRQGIVSAQRYTFDEQDATGEYDTDFRKRWIPSIESLGLAKTHSKWFVLSGRSRQDSILSSSNDGCEGGHMEWWASSRDSGLAKYLTTCEGHSLAVPSSARSVGKVSAESIGRASSLLPLPLAQVSVVRTSSQTPSAAILFWLIQACDEPVDLSMLSFSSSMGFVERLAELRQMGCLGSLHWSIDHSLKSRKSSTSEGRVLQMLANHFPGEVFFPHARIHGKWAVIRTASQTISILTSANWQETNPREESYVVVTDPTVAAGLEAAQQSLEAKPKGKPGRQPPVDPRPPAAPMLFASPLPRSVQTSAYSVAELEAARRLTAI